MSENFQAKIENVYGSLSKGHKKIADYIRSNYEKASFMTAASLGKAVGVSESTVVRFASNIGFEGYPELQKYLQEMVKSHLTSVQRMEVAASRYEGSDFIDKTFSADAELIKSTRESISREAFAGSVEAINKAIAEFKAGTLKVFNTANFAVGGKTLTTEDNALVSDGYFHESEAISAPSFDIRIDGITLLNEKY